MGEDTFSGRAFRLRAEQGLKEIRNALAAYKIKNGQYPDAENWEKELKPYLRKERHPDPTWVTKRKMVIMVAKNNITTARGVLKELKRKIYFADTTLQGKIMEYLGSIDSALTLAEYEVIEARRYEYRDIRPELKGLHKFVSNLNLSKERENILNRMELRHKELNKEINELKVKLLGEDSTFNKTVEDAFRDIERVLEESFLQAKGEATPYTESLTVYSEVIDNLTLKLNPKKDLLLIKELKKLDEDITYYAQGKDNIEFLSYIRELIKKLPASINLFDNYYNKNREVVLEANRVLNGYASLIDLRSLVHFFEQQNDSMPTGNLYIVFKEDEDMKEIREDLSSDPYLYMGEAGYRIEAKAIDTDQTLIVLKVDFIDTYDGIVKESFSSGPYYSTNDSNTTFFVMVKAKDREKSIMTTIPKFSEEERRK